ncbi:hypothetical protein G4Z16_00620 [Streptomyces bathyalis]|uniref:Uncharacterized protein n=1 Tax=Streptomyces bathyalis TaxID=2710756 RepID=A0A7T1WPR8_9ACTN|nr:hypothetical protein [Streptomyces bathyalis]QPP05138.1 hypothetical protein G4Z16_00620 [Streptomyces bathyalis]
MRTCQRFARIKADFERDIAFLLRHAERHQGETSAKVSRTTALGARQRMAQALNRHLAHCRECG